MVEISALVIIDYYKNLNEKDRVALREEILDATGMAYTSFYNKINGRTDFTKSELYVISNLITEDKNVTKD